ncbi:MAG: GNAT family N-acetyltransferase [Lachnospiraceae bacterium]|nr:GNAT family N-acetyltransferase [Lachnospiraceae bacterium]
MAKRKSRFGDTPDQHHYLEVNGDFRMRELDKGDLEQFNALLQYAFQVTSYDLFQTGWKPEEIKSAKRPMLEEAYVLGWFYKDRLASMIVVYSMRVNVYDEIMDMGGITGVATYPEYTGRGLIHALMRRVLDYMHRQKMPISFLYPYSIPFYRKMGWELVSDKLTFTIKDTQLPKPHPVEGMVERVSLDSEDYHNVHSYFALQQHGALIRDELSWEEYWRWDNEDMIAAVYYSKEHKPLGYVVYYIANDVFYIKEMVYLNIEANHGLWNYISAHFSMINEVKGANYSGETLAYLLEDSEIVETISPYIMARIINVEDFLRDYPYQIKQEDLKIHFRVHDQMAPWNEGDFMVSWHDGETVCEKVDDNQSINVVELTINTLTTMLMGYKRPSYLYEHEKIQTEYYMLTWLERLIPAEKPYFSDYF